MSLDADIDVILADGEDIFIAGGVTAMVSIMEHDAAVGDSNVIVGAGYVLVRASLFPDLSTNDPVTLNGVAYKVSQKMRIQDGRVLQVFFGDGND